MGARREGKVEGGWKGRWKEREEEKEREGGRHGQMPKSHIYTTSKSYQSGLISRIAQRKIDRYKDLRR